MPIGVISVFLLLLNNHLTYKSMELGSGLALLGSAKLIEKLLGPTCEYIGQNIQQLTKRMHDNLTKIFINAEAKLGDRINEEGKVPPKVLKSILENGAWCEEELQCEYFGGVLASSRSAISRDDRGAYLANLVSKLSSYHIRMHYLIYTEIRNLFSGNSNNICEQTTRRNLEIYIPVDTYVKAMDFSEEEVNRLLELTPHILFGLSNIGLIENNFQYGPRESVIKRYSNADNYGIIVQPSQMGVELFMWAYGYGLEPLTSFFDSTLIFNPIEGIIIGKAYSTK